MLFGVIDDYTPYVIIGAFDSLSGGHNGLSEFRRKHNETYNFEAYSRYLIYHIEPNTLYGLPNPLNTDLIKPQIADEFVPDETR